MSYEVLNIPEKCNGCAIQSDLINKIAELLVEKQSLIKIGESLVGEPGEQHKELLYRLYNESDAEEILLGTRKIMGNKLEKNDTELDNLIKKSHEYSDECDGASRIKLTKADVVYTLGICSANSVYKDEDGSPVRLHLTLIADEAL